MAGLEIIPAEHGGFVVFIGSSISDRGLYRSMLYAGSLADCLEFMRARLSSPPPATDDARRAA